MAQRIQTPVVSVEGPGGATLSREIEPDRPGICLHCGLSIPGDRRERDDPFCCNGCEAVYRLIHNEGLDRYYDLRRGAGTPPATYRENSFYWLDALLAERGLAEGSGNAPLRLTLDLQGVRCAACVWLLQELYRRHPAGLSLRINPSLGQADLVWDRAAGDLKDYLRQAEGFGYRFGPSVKTPARRSRSLLIRLGICCAAAMNVMIFSLCYYFGLGPGDGALYKVIGLASAAAATIAVAVGGSVFFRSIFAGLRHGLIHLDWPIGLGIALAYAGSVYAYLSRGPEAAYFDTVTIFITLMLLGRWLQERVIERNRNSLLAAEGTDHLFVRRITRDGFDLAPAIDLRQGDEILVVPGDLVPVSGRLVRGSAWVSLDWITGESDPRRIEAGGEVQAGAFNAGRSSFRLTAAEDFARSRLHQLLQTPREQPGPRGSRGERWWSRIATVYVLGVLTLAAAGFLAWAGRDPGKAMEVTIALLVVTCPCALGLAVPLAHELVHLALRRSGVFVRGRDFLDKALSIRKILFDKTGTLTLGRLVLDPDGHRALARLEPEERLALYNMTARSNHPISRAIVDAFGTSARESGSSGRLQPERPALVPEGDAVAEVGGQGLEWHWRGQVYRLGRSAFAESARSGSTGATAGATVLSRDGEALAAFRFDEELKADAHREVSRLQGAGHDVYLLSGDTREKTAAAALRLGIPAERASGGLSPEAKSSWVRRIDDDDTLMVGDGLNDAPSFEAAFAAATPAVDLPAIPARADFYFLGEGLAAVRRALTAARKLRQVIRGNLVLAALYNAAAITLCFAGLVSPVTAAVIMPISSVTFVLLTFHRLSGRRLEWMS